LLVASHIVLYGAPVTVAIDVQLFVPVGVNWNSTLWTPEPETSLAVACSGELGPPMVLLVLGCVIEPIGSVLSTTTVRVALVPVWPAPSVAIARSSYVSSVSEPVANGAWKGGPTVAIETHVAAPCRRCWNSTVAVSASLAAEIVGVPWMAAPGSFTEGVGDWLSTVTVTAAEVVTLPAGSVARTVSCTGPSATPVVSHVVLDELPLPMTEPLTRKA
jgi:hypothetical protein